MRYDLRFELTSIDFAGHGFGYESNVDDAKGAASNVGVVVA